LGKDYICICVFIHVSVCAWVYMYIIYMTSFWVDNTHFNIFFSENYRKLCNVWDIQRYYMLFLIMGINICQSDRCFSWSGFTIARKFWPIKEEKGEPSLKSKLTSNPPPPLKKHRKIIFVHLVPFWNASSALIIFPCVHCTN